MPYIWSIYSIHIYLSYSYTSTLCGTSLLPSLRLWLTPFSVPWHSGSGHVAGHKVRTCEVRQLGPDIFWWLIAYDAKKYFTYCWFCWWTIILLTSWEGRLSHEKNKVYWFQVVQDFWTINSMIWSICYHKRSKFIWHDTWSIWSENKIEHDEW